MKKRFLAMLLSLAMVFAMLPTAAFAADDAGDGTVTAPKVDGYGFHWNATAADEKLPGDYSNSGDWMGETVYVSFEDRGSDQKPLWFEVTVPEVTSSSGENQMTVSDNIWGCAADGGTAKVLAFSFLNRGSQWEQPGKDFETGNVVETKGTNATSYLKDQSSVTSIELTVYTTDTVLTQAPENKTGMTEIFSTAIPVRSNSQEQDVNVAVVNNVDLTMGELTADQSLPSALCDKATVETKWTVDGEAAANDAKFESGHNYVATFTVTAKDRVAAAEKVPAYDYEIAKDAAYTLKVGDAEAGPLTKDNLTYSKSTKVMTPLTAGDVSKAILKDTANKVTDVVDSDYAIAVKTNATETDTLSTAEVNTVAITATGLKNHQNAETNMGYWIGFAVKAPTGATGFKYASGATEAAVKDLSNATTNVLEENVVNTDSGVAFYFNAADSNANMYRSVQFVKTTGAGEGATEEDVTDVYVFKADLQNVKKAYKVTFPAANEVKNVSEISATEGTNSTALNSGDYVAENTAVTLTVTPEDGYTVTVKNGDTALTEGTEDKAGTYTFTPAADSKITVTATDATQQKTKIDTVALAIAEKVTANSMLPTQATSTTETVTSPIAITWAEKDAAEGATAPTTAVAGKTYVATMTVTPKDAETHELSADTTYTLTVGDENAAVVKDETTVGKLTYTVTVPSESGDTPVALSTSNVSLSATSAVLTNGSATLPEVNVNVTGAVKDTNYTVTWKDSAGNAVSGDSVTAAGTYTVTVEAKANDTVVSGSVDLTFNVTATAPELTALTKANIGVAALHDQSNQIADDKLIKDYGIEVAELDASKTNKVTIKGTDLQKHTNAGNPSVAGYWVGFQVVAPEGATSLMYGFADTAENAKTLAAHDLENLPNNKQGIAFYTNVGAEDQKKYAAVQFLKGDESLTATYFFEIDTTGVTPYKMVPTLTVKDDDKNLITFDADKTSYVANVANTVSEVAVETNGTAKTVAADGTKTDVADNKVTLVAGDDGSVTTIEVTFEGVADTYTVTVVRAKKTVTAEDTATESKPTTVTSGGTAVEVDETKTLVAIGNASTQEGVTNKVTIDSTVPSTVTDEVKTAEVTLPATVAQSLHEHAVDAEIETDVGTVTLPAEAVTQALTVTETNEDGDEVEVVKADKLVLEVSKNETAAQPTNVAAAFDVTIKRVDAEDQESVAEIKNLTNPIVLTFPIPDDVKDDNPVLVFIEAVGSLTRYTKVESEVKGANIVGTTKHLSTYGIMSQADYESAAAQNPRTVSFTDTKITKVEVSSDGTATPTQINSGDTIQAGQTVIVTVQAPTAGQTAAVSVGDDVTVTKGENNTFTFVMPDKDVTISVTYTTPSYNITVTAPSGVTIRRRSGEDVTGGWNSTPGTSETFTVIKADASKFANVTITDADGTKVFYTKDGDTYTFEKPAKDVTITVTLTDTVDDQNLRLTYTKKENLNATNAKKFYDGRLTIEDLVPGKRYVITFDYDGKLSSNTAIVPRAVVVMDADANGKIEVSCQRTMRVTVQRTAADGDVNAEKLQAIFYEGAAKDNKGVLVTNASEITQATGDEE